MPDAVDVFTVLPLQAKFLRDERKMGAARGGVGSGKTVICSIWMLKRMVEYPYGAHYVCGADYPQLKRGFLNTFRGLLDRFGYDYTYSTSNGTLTLDDYGATMHCLSAELSERIRSVEIDTVLLEEPQTWEGEGAEEVFETIVGRLRRSPGSMAHHPDIQPQLRMSFNPPDMAHWLYDVCEKRWPKEGYECLKFSVRDNYLMGVREREEYVRMLEATYDPARWPSQIDGEWSTVGGDVYRGFDPEIHGVNHDGLPNIGLNREQPLLWSLDFNVGHMASVVCQAYVQPMVPVGVDRRPGIEPTTVYGPQVVGAQRRIIYAVDELFLTDAGMPDVMAEFLRRHGDQARRYGLRLYGDGTGGGRSQIVSSQSSVRSNWDIVEDGLQRAGIPYEIFIQTQNPSEGDRVNAVRAQFRTGEGFGFLIDLQACPHVVNDFRGVKYVEGKNEIEKPTSGKGAELTHISDALGYLIWVERCLENRQPPKFRDYFNR